MTTTSVGVPFPVYTDTSGDPVDAGYLYLGVAGLNPEVSPIQAYWDTDLTIPAAQPIRTSGGYPMRGGSPGRLFVAAANYSITLKDRASRLVWSSLNGAGLGVDLQIQLAFSTTLFTAVGGETVLSTGQPYTSEMLYIDQNGLGLYSGVHFTETTNTTITLASPAIAGDVFRIRVGQFLGASAVENRLGALEAETSMSVHVAAADPHPGYMTTAEGAALITAHEAAADPHTGYVTTAELAAASGIGVGQTWQNVLASRVGGTVYQNTTGKPICVNIVCSCAVGTAELYVGEVNPPTVAVAQVLNNGYQVSSSISAIVPNNSYYMLQNTAVLTGSARWAELRA